MTKQELIELLKEHKRSLGYMIDNLEQEYAPDYQFPLSIRHDLESIGNSLIRRAREVRND